MQINKSSDLSDIFCRIALKEAEFIQTTFKVAHNIKSGLLPGDLGSLEEWARMMTALKQCLDNLEIIKD